jgi:hypothetical protein
MFNDIRHTSWILVTVVKGCKNIMNRTNNIQMECSTLSNNEINILSYQNRKKHTY